MFAIRSSLFVLPAAALLACSGPARVDLDPTSARLFGRDQSTTIRATPVDGKGRPLPLETCVWSSSDEKVATVTGAGNEATVKAVGVGSAVIKCEVGAVSAMASITVRIVDRISVSPKLLELKMLDTPEPGVVKVEAFDSDGTLLSGRAAMTSCVDEAICRGDNRGQVWPVGPGESTVIVQVDGARAEVQARVTDERTADAKPKPMKGNPMLIYEKLFGEEAQAKAKKQEEARAKKKKP